MSPLHETKHVSSPDSHIDGQSRFGEWLTNRLILLRWHPVVQVWLQAVDELIELIRYPNQDRHKKNKWYRLTMEDSKKRFRLAEIIQQLKGGRLNVCFVGGKNPTYNSVAINNTAGLAIITYVIAIWGPGLGKAKFIITCYSTTVGSKPKAIRRRAQRQQKLR